MKKTAVILGMHQATFGEFDQTRTDCDVFVFNEMVSRGTVAHADYVYQLHKPVVWRSSQNRNDGNHYDWLKNNTEAVIFMQDEYPDVPMSRKFPLEAIIAAFPGAERYFTTTVGYALAYAIYAGYKRIEIYGVEMETNTEYAHQRPCVAYWCGVGLGKGLEIDFHSENFFKSPLYGYDGDITIPLETFEQRAKLLAEGAKKVLAEYKQARVVMKDTIEAFRKDFKVGCDSFERYVNACAQLGHQFNLYDGALQVVQRHIKACKVMEAETGSYFLSRQVYETERNSSQNSWQAHQHNIKLASDALADKEKELRTATSSGYRNRRVAEYLALVDEYIKVIGKAGIYSGVGMESQNLMNIQDQNERMAGGAEAVKVLAEAGVQA